MLFEEYAARARATAVYPEVYGRKDVYPMLGLIGETGELAEKVKKSLRDGWSLAMTQNAVAAEAGDVLWYIAAVAFEYGIVWAPAEATFAEYDASIGEYLQGGGALLAIQLSSDVARLAMPLERELMTGELQDAPRKEYREVVLKEVLRTLTRLCHAYNVTLAAAAEKNLAKLDDRAKRGALHGSGDNR